jgi:hypothetical protein
MFTHIRRSAAASTLILASHLVIPEVPASAAERCTIAAAGDVAGKEDWQTGAASTGRLIEEAQPRLVLALGDLAYNSGTREEFRKYYDPTWGGFRSITRPTPGNHEYYTGALGSGGHDATAYFEYFDVPPQYSFDACGWHIVSLNSQTNPDRQADFLREDVAAHSGKPLLIFWHEPRFSSGNYGASQRHQKLWAAANEVGASVVLTGHEHLYERFAQLDTWGNRHPNGVRQFISGTGGHNPRQPSATRAAHSQQIVTGRGVLFLDLDARGYGWRFISPDWVTRDEGYDTVSR